MKMSAAFILMLFSLVAHGAALEPVPNEDIPEALRVEKTKELTPQQTAILAIIKMDNEKAARRVHCTSLKVGNTITTDCE